LVLLTELRGILLRLERAVEVNTRERRETNEAIGRLARQHVELRRDLGRTELHLFPHHNRRRPLG
jgi:hypothetical protein